MESGGLDGEAVDGLGFAEQVSEAPLVGKGEDLGEAGLAEVAVDEEDALVDLGEGDAEVGDGGGFAFLGAGGSEDDDARAVAVLAGEEDGGEGGAEGLGEEGGLALPGDELDGVVGVAGRGVGGEGVALAVIEVAAGVEVAGGDDAELGEVEVEGRVAGGLDGAVDALAGDDEDDAEEEPVRRPRAVFMVRSGL